MKKYLIILVILLTSHLWSDWHLQESFEAGIIPADFTIYNGSEGSTWTAYENEDYSYNGSWAAFSDSYYPEDEDNWLILPQITIESGDSLHLYIRSWYSTESFDIKVSNQSCEIEDFSDLILSVDNQTEDYTHYSIDLSAYAGEDIFMGINWNCFTYGLLVDNILVGQSAGTQELTIDLPESFSFEQSNTLTVDFSEYITAEDLEMCSLSVEGNSNIGVQIDALLVSFSSINWCGSENLVFTVSDDMGNTADDEIMIIVEAAEVYNIGIEEIISPSFLVCLNNNVQPAVLLVNNGNLPGGELSLLMEYVISDNLGNQVFYTAQEMDINLDPMEEEIINFTDCWEPDQEGDYSIMINFELEDAVLTDNQIEREFICREHFGTGGPDEFGYRWQDSTQPDGPQFNWLDISETGTSAITLNVNAFHGDDNFCEPVEFGFDFNFYGIDYSSFMVDTNGEILLCDNTWYEPYPSNGWDNDGNVFNWAYPIPGYTQMPGLIAVFWDDLEAEEGVGDIYFESFGESPARFTVVQWHNLKFHTGEGEEELLDFEVVFHESGEILMQYNNTATGQYGSNAPHDWGQSATVGIQNQTAEIGLCYLQEQVEGSSWVGVIPEGNIITSELAISFFTGDDNIPPFVSHQAVGNTLQNSAVITASISDMSGIDQALLHYNCGNGWDNMEHTEFVEPNIYCFEINGLIAGQEIQYYFSAIDGSAAANEAFFPEMAPEEFFSFRVLPYADHNALLAYSQYQDYTGEELQVWQNVLESSGIQADQYNWQQSTEIMIPDQYDVVYFFANSSSHSEELDSLCIALMNWLDSGSQTAPKNVFFASDGFAYNQSGHPNSSPMKKLLNAYFRTSYVGTTIGGGTNGLGGPDHPYYEEGSIQVISDSPLGVEGEEIDVFANSPDCIFRYEACPSWYEDQVINPQIGAHNSFIFEDGPCNGQAYLYHGVCGTWIDNLIYKAFFFSFDLSQLVNAEDRNRIITDSANWFELFVPNMDENIPISRALLTQNYPNPFSPKDRAQTTIKYKAGNSEKAELTIYNIKGRKIRGFSSRVIPNSWNSFSWDGKDQHDNLTAAGVYFYQLKLDGKTIDTRKMIFIR